LNIHRAIKLLVAVTILAFLIILTLVDQFGYADRAQQADVIVLLGSMVYPGGKLGPALERRAQHTAGLYQRGLAANIICSGGIGTNPPAEAVVACGRLAELGLPASALVLEDQSRNTEENAANTARMMRARGWQSAILVSDGFHLYRATQMFERAGMTIYPSPAQATVGPMDPLERIVREMREALGVAWFWLRATLAIDQTAHIQSQLNCAPATLPV
jgi:uncharacterized SAM-binding protein YcdF (DUF218 family)